MVKDSKGGDCMVINDIAGIVINPVKLKEQCSLIMQNYEYENATYSLLSKRVCSLCEEEGLKGNSISGFQY